MKTLKNIHRPIQGVALVTALILMIPFIAMQFTAEVDWGAGDFIVMFMLLFCTGLCFVLIMRSGSGIAYKAAFGLAMAATFFMIWANLAVGLIGSGPNLANLMYMGVPAVGLICSFLSGFKANGMQHAMFAIVLSLVVHTIISFLAGMHQLPGGSVNEIIAVNGFFCLLFMLSGLLFRFAAQQQATV